jgi:hypothetical protein
MAIEFMIPLYLLVTANFLGDTLGKDAQRVMKNNMIAKHVVILLAIVFAFVLADPNYADKNMDLVLVQAVIVYALFVMSVRLPFPALALVVALLAGAYLAHRQTKRDPGGAVGAETAKTVLGNAAIAVIVIGFLAKVLLGR